MDGGIIELTHCKNWWYQKQGGTKQRKQKQKRNDRKECALADAAAAMNGGHKNGSLRSVRTNGQPVSMFWLGRTTFVAGLRAHYGRRLDRYIQCWADLPDATIQRAAPRERENSEWIIQRNEAIMNHQSCEGRFAVCLFRASVNIFCGDGVATAQRCNEDVLM